MMFGDDRNPFREGLWNCLLCDKQIREHVYDQNNGVCNDCPPLMPKVPSDKAAK